jgi:hypothetical protein
MGERRTRKQKLKAKHQFNLSWTPQPQSSVLKASVKGQIVSSLKTRLEENKHTKKAVPMAKDGSFEAYKRDTVKSLVLASIILAAELVLYLAWK